MSKVFLGGTCAGPDYRSELIPLLKAPYFNPVVANWTIEDATRENDAKRDASANVFVITPAAIGSYSIAEMVELAITSKKPLIFMFYEIGDFRWNEHQIKSNTQICQLLQRYGAIAVADIPSLARAINEVPLNAFPKA